MNDSDLSIAVVQTYLQKIEEEYLQNDQMIAMLLLEDEKQRRDVALAEIFYQTAKDSLLLGMPRRALRYAVLLEQTLWKLQPDS